MILLALVLALFVLVGPSAGVRMRVASSNIKDNPDMPAAHVRDDVRAVRDWTRPGHVVGWQEIGERADHRAIDRYFVFALGWRQLFRRRATPVSVRTLAWKVVSTSYTQTHAGRGGVTPARGYGTVVLAHRWRRRLPPIAIINHHAISGAWYGQHSHQDWRRARWRQHFAELDAHVASLTAAGVSCVVLGDWNRRRSDIPRFQASQLWAVGHGYDHVAICPAVDGAQPRLAGQRIHGGDLYTDHRPILVDIYWS